MGKLQKFFYLAGVLLLGAALLLTVHNLREEDQAQVESESVLSQLLVSSSPSESTSSGENPKAEEFCEKQEEEETALPEETMIPDYILDPERDMPETEIDEEKYIGILKIPALSLELPVISEWSYASLRKAPCRYSGSAYTGDLVIAAHNYSSHFGKIRELSLGDAVTLTDLDENQFVYRVAEVEILSPYAVEEMTNGDWDLTLFTCTVGGQSRVAVRCEMLRNEN